MFTRAIAILLVALIAIGASPREVSAQSFPSKVVRIIVAQAAGGLNDLLAREIANELGSKWKQPAIVDPRPGAGGTIAADAVAKAAPDGHTLIFSTQGPVLVSAFVTKNLPFDPLTAFVPVLNVARTPTVIFARNSLPVSNVKELVAYAKANPGNVSYASSGAGSGLHFETEIFAGSVDIKLLHIPYKSGAESVRAVITGEADMALTSITQARSQISSGQVKGIAVSSRKRIPFLPNVATFEESGFPQIELGISWFGFFAPGGTPREIVDTIAQDIGEVVRRTAFVERLTNHHGLEMMVQMPDEFAAQVKKERVDFDALTRRLGFSVLSTP